MTTGQDILDAAYAACDIPSTAYSSATFLLGWVNKGLSKLHYALADDDNTWATYTSQLSITSGTATVTLPTSPKFYKARAVYYRQGSNRYAIPRFEHGAEVDGWEVLPLQSGVIDLVFVTEFAPLATIGTAIDTIYPAGWEDYVSMFVATRMAIRDESFEQAQMLAGERDQALSLILQRAATRDNNLPQRVKDVTGRWNGENESCGTVPDWHYQIEGSNLVIMQRSVYGR